MKCSICGKRVEFPARFYSTGPLLQRGWACDECYRTWVEPYQERELERVPDSIVWFSNAYYAEDHLRRK